MRIRVMEKGYPMVPGVPRQPGTRSASAVTLGTLAQTATKCEAVLRNPSGPRDREVRAQPTNASSTWSTASGPPGEYLSSAPTQRRTE